MTTTHTFAVLFSACAMWHAQHHLHHVMAHVRWHLLQSALDGRAEHLLDFGIVVAVTTDLWQLTNVTATFALFITTGLLVHINWEAFLLSFGAHQRSCAAFDLETAESALLWSMGQVGQLQFVHHFFVFLVLFGHFNIWTVLLEVGLHLCGWEEHALV